MIVEDLDALGDIALLHADIAIVGGGPTGLTIAKEFSGRRQSVVVLESGDQHYAPRHEPLNTVENLAEPSSPAQVAKRRAFHGASAMHWTHEVQPFGVRCRGLGGSTAAWAGKSAAFDPIDFQQRAWVPHSGWPIALESLESALDRAAHHLNLGPNIYDDRLWALAGAPTRAPRFDDEALVDFFWQFARSRLDPLDVMRAGPDFLAGDAANVRVILNATATDIETDNGVFCGVIAQSLSGKTLRVSARVGVLAASGLENPRLLLAARNGAGLGNAYDQVGRYLMDHLGARVARYAGPDLKSLERRFGFVSLTQNHRTHMYMPGLAPSPIRQAQSGSLNCALYAMPERASDDPLDALKRVVRGKSASLGADVWSVAKAPGYLAKAIGMKAFRSRLMPAELRSGITDLVLKLSPDFAADEFMTGGLPHKITAIAFDAISEQAPDPNNRVTLSSQRDQFGVPLARVSWTVGDQGRQSLAALGRSVVDALQRHGLPTPTLEPWIENNRPDEAVIIDMAHTLGATRMSTDPRDGVVDLNCRVHDTRGLYVAGGSVFPTSGHANPTLMILALAVRLSDHLKREFDAHDFR